MLFWFGTTRLRRAPRLAAALGSAAAIALAGCAAPVAPVAAPAPMGMTRITGEISYLQRIALPPDAVAVVIARETRSGTLLAEDRQALNGRQVPVPFTLSVPRGAAAAAEVRGSIEQQGRAMWISEPVVVRLEAESIDLGTLRLAQMAAGSTSGPSTPPAATFSAVLRCHARHAEVALVRQGGADVMQLTIGSGATAAAPGAQRFALRQVRTGSGARHEAIDDPTSWVWFRGDVANVSVRGEAWPECDVASPGQPVPVRARGNEPSWSLRIGQRLVFKVGELTLDGTLPPLAAKGNSRTTQGSIEGRSISVVLTATVCNDNMSGMPHPLTAQVTVDGRTYRGCGGAPAELLHGAPWGVEDLAGRGLIDRSRVTLTFGTDGRVSGRASCNSYSGPYTLTGETLRIGPTAGTLMACPEALMDEERRLFNLLAQINGFAIDASGALLLQTSERQRIRARR